MVESLVKWKSDLEMIMVTDNSTLFFHLIFISSKLIIYVKVAFADLFSITSTDSFRESSFTSDPNKLITKTMPYFRLVRWQGPFNIFFRTQTRIQLYWILVYHKFWLPEEFYVNLLITMTLLSSINPILDRRIHKSVNEPMC